jgi:hypothetical protein
VRLSGLIVLVACAERVPGQPIPLVDLGRFERVTGADDPFAGEGGDDVDCPESAARETDFGGEPALDVSTDGCPRITVAQPALVQVRAGDHVTVRAWRDPLFASGEDGAEAVMALAIDGEEIWRTAIPIPQPSGAIALGDVPAPRSWPEGAQVAWHVHNHGKNSYHLLDVDVRPLVPPRLAEAE